MCRSRCGSVVPHRTWRLNVKKALARSGWIAKASSGGVAPAPASARRGLVLGRRRQGRQGIEHLRWPLAPRDPLQAHHGGRAQPILAVVPPSIGMTAPVMKLARSEARNDASSATSSGWPAA